MAEKNYWDNLSIREKAKAIKIVLQNGAKSVQEIRNIYNKIRAAQEADAQPQVQVQKTPEQILQEQIDQQKSLDSNNAFTRKEHNDSPTQKQSEDYEENAAIRIMQDMDIAKRKGHDASQYFIPYNKDKEIKVDGIGRVSTNALDSLAVNANRAGISIIDALGIAGQETNLGAVPRYAFPTFEEWKKTTLIPEGTTDAQLKKLYSENIRAYFNQSFFRNYGGIYPQNLINDHEWSDRGWEKSDKYKKLLGNIESPLQHGFTMHKMGIYNTGEKDRESKIESKGNSIFNDSDVAQWWKDSGQYWYHTGTGPESYSGKPTWNITDTMLSIIDDNNKKYGGEVNILDDSNITQSAYGVPPLDISTKEYQSQLDAYKNKKIEAIVNQALDNSYNRTLPAIPDMGKDYMGSINTCIYTALDNFGKKYRVPGNITFSNNPLKYGFEEVPIGEKVKSGDLIQSLISVDTGTGIRYEPRHMMLYTGKKNKYNDYLLNYSTGGKDTSDIVKDGIYYYINDDVCNNKKGYRAYRFVGNKEDNDLWDSEFYNIYKKERSQREKDWVDQARKVKPIQGPVYIGDTRIYKNGGFLSKNPYMNYYGVPEKFRENLYIEPVAATANRFGVQAHKNGGVLNFNKYIDGGGVVKGQNDLSSDKEYINESIDFIDMYNKMEENSPSVGNGTILYSIDNDREHPTYDENGLLSSYYKSIDLRSPIKIPTNNFSNILSQARDSHIGGIGVQQIRDLYNNDNYELANELSKRYAIYNAAGIAAGALGEAIIATDVVPGVINGYNTLYNNANLMGKGLLEYGKNALIGNVGAEVVRGIFTPEWLDEHQEGVALLDDALNILSILQGNNKFTEAIENAAGVSGKVGFRTDLENFIKNLKQGKIEQGALNELLAEEIYTLSTFVPEGNKYKELLDIFELFHGLMTNRYDTKELEESLGINIPLMFENPEYRFDPNEWYKFWKWEKIEKTRKSGSDIIKEKVKNKVKKKMQERASGYDLTD